MPRLIHEKTQKFVQVGDVVHSFRGRPHIVTGWEEPRHPASTGRLWVQTMDERRAHSQYFPSVFNCGWIGRTDQQ